jgi:hypothetical protein
MTRYQVLLAHGFEADAQCQGADIDDPVNTLPATTPGRMALTRMLSGPNSAAKDFIRPTIAHFFCRWLFLGAPSYIRRIPGRKLPLKLVSLVHAHFHRIGSAQGGGFSRHKTKTVIDEVTDDKPETVREFVISTAEANGESRDALADLRLEPRYTVGENRMVFNIQGGSTSYSSPYAVCDIITALKVGERFFKLEEVKL